MYEEQDYQWARPYLGNDESILWKGKPEKLHLLELTDIYMIPFSLLWAGFAIFWEYSVFRSGAPIFFMLFGGFFVLIGLFMVFGRFLFKAMLLKGTSYVITDKNVLIYQKQQIKVLKKESLPSLSVKRFKDGTGTIALEESSLFRRRSRYGARYTMDMQTLCGIRDELHGIAEPERVLRLLQTDSSYYS